MMNSLQRVAATMEGRPTDRRAVCLVLSLYGAKLTGCPLSEYYADSEAYARGQSAVLETFEPDFLFGPVALPFEGEAFGSELAFFENREPNLRRPALRSAKELRELPSPDLDRHPRLLYIRRAIRRMAADHGGRLPIAATSLSPDNLPSMWMGLEAWLDTLLFDEDGRRRALDRASDFFVRWANALLEDGARFLAIPTTFMNPAIVTREMAVELVLPTLKDAFSRVKGPILIHSGGTSLLPFLDLFGSLPNVVGFVQNDRDGFAEARRTLGPGPTLIGNVEGVGLARRLAADVKAECARILIDRRDDRRFMLGTSGGNIAFDTPAEIVQAFGQAADEASAARGGTCG